MKFNKIALSITLFCFSPLLLAAPAPIVVSSLDQGANTEQSFAIGIVSSIAKRPFVGVDDQNASLLYLSYRYEDFFIEGLDLGYKLNDNKKYNISVLATPRFYEVEPGFAENGELDGIDKTSPTYMAGLSLQTKFSGITTTFQALHDVIESDGNELLIQASKLFKTNKTISLTPSIGITYQDAELVDHFYGVQAHEVRVGRAIYKGKASVNYNVSLHAKWVATKHIEFIGQIRYEVLGDGITKSSIVDEDTINSLSLGMLYRF